MGIRPATPGTLVVFTATVLLVLVSVSTPLLKSIYFLEATLATGGYSGTVRLGAWGYCVGDTCTSPKFGYSLNIAELLDINGRLSGFSNSVLKWITYLMVLHPIAAIFGVISVIFGLLAHMRNFAGTGLTTCFASFAATFSLLAFVFDIVVFVIAKQRINSSSVGGNASLGPAVWMTLAAMVLFGLSGCFFGCGKCVIRKQRAGREASEKNRPMPDSQYGSQLRGDALAAHERDKAYLAENQRREGVLPAFAEHERDKEDIPLNSMHAVAFEDDEYQPRAYPPPPSHPSHERGPNYISGVGEGYGRRNDAPVGSDFQAGYSNYPPPAPSATPNNAGRGTGVGSRLAADARAERGYVQPTTEAFLGMYDHPTPQPPTSDQYHSTYDHDRDANRSPSSALPSMQMPVPQTYSAGAHEPQYPQQQLSPSYQGSYPAYPVPPPALTPGGGTTGEKLAPPLPQRQSFHVQNPSGTTNQYGPESVSGHQQQGYSNHNPVAGGGSSIQAPTYHSYEDPYASPYHQQQAGNSIDYHASGQQQPRTNMQHDYGYPDNRY
ncbi:uncharacterized protein JCM15063_005911 [Sporobolomyces koalae]|uniref:uncharacterized protein n=1 Tax=Sporobolomyces koalae TaxID=500713 RepID=UPI0031741E12